jgi:crotonobetainyl-CoA:carnitine CoA-transferase CaiB-like acyl-CoA transferase
VRELLECRLAERSGSEWSAELSGAGVPAGLVNDIGQAFALAESLGLDPIVELLRSPDDPQPVRLPRSPIRLSRTPVSYRSAPPPLGLDEVAELRVER